MMLMRTRVPKGFTLIELLIVVAIIGILAAIAVPNFLNAQIRAKVSRCVSDMKTLETGLEMYKMDTGEYPAWHHARVKGSGDSTHPNEIRFYRMTTPISYISSVPRDPFTSPNLADWAQWGWAYDYINNYDPDNKVSVDNHTGGWGHVWRLNSWGPDGVNGWGGNRNVDGTCINGNPQFVYNASNGLNSHGDIIWVGAKDGLCPPASFCNIINGY